MSINAPTVTINSGFYNNTMPQSFHRESTEARIARMLARPTARGMRKVMRALNGVAPGAPVVDTYVRITQPPAFAIAGFGGNRGIETVTGRDNGNTTTAQRDYINANVLDMYVTTQPYPVDLSGQGGGGKVQR